MSTQPHRSSRAGASVVGARAHPGREGLVAGVGRDPRIVAFGDKMIKWLRASRHRRDSPSAQYVRHDNTSQRSGILASSVSALSTAAARMARRSARRSDPDPDGAGADNDDTPEAAELWERLPPARRRASASCNLELGSAGLLRVGGMPASVLTIPEILMDGGWTRMEENHLAVEQNAVGAIYSGKHVKLASDK